MPNETELLEKAVTEVMTEFRRKNRIAPGMEQAVMESSRQIVSNAYGTAFEMQKSFPKKPVAVNHIQAKGNERLDAASKAELEQLMQSALADDERRNARNYSRLQETHRGLLITLFRNIGTSDQTAQDLTALILAS